MPSTRDGTPYIRASTERLSPISLLTTVTLASLILAIGCTRAQEPSGPEAGDQPGVLASVVVRPPSSVVRPGARQQFSAAGEDLYSNIVPVQITWEATGGTISSQGVFTAGVSTGAFEVMATDSSGVADTASVAVTQRSAGNAPKPGPNDVILWRDNYDHGSEADVRGYTFGGASYNRFNGYNWVWRVPGHDGGNATRLLWQGISECNDRSHRFEVNLESIAGISAAQRRHVYIQIWYRYQDGFLSDKNDHPDFTQSCSAGSGAKVMYFERLTGGTSCRDGLIVQNMNKPTGTEQQMRGAWNLGVEKGANCSSDAENTFVIGDPPNALPSGSPLTPTGIGDGEWHQFVWELKMESAAGASDGVARMWIDGTMVIENFPFGGASGIAPIRHIEWPSVYNRGSPVDQWQEVDDVVIWTPTR